MTPTDHEPTRPAAAERDVARGDAERPEPTWRCDVCGAPMLDRHCKLVCTRCGYQRDCSDP